jgi:hypothetical protein
VREYLFSSPHCGKQRRAPLWGHPDLPGRGERYESITWLNKFFLATEFMECLGREQLNFGVGQMNPAQNPPHTGSWMHSLPSPCWSNLVSRTFKCGSPSKKKKCTKEWGHQEENKNISTHPVTCSAWVFYAIGRSEFLCNRIKVCRG